MAKIRVYEVARQFDVSSEAMVNLLREMDVPVKNHMSSIDEETIERIRGKFDQEKEAVKHAEEEKKKKLGDAKKARRVEKARTKTESETAVVATTAQETESEETGGAETDDRPAGRRPRRRRRRRKVDQAAVEANIKKTLAKMEGKSTRRRKRVRREEGDEPGEIAEPENLIRVTEFVSVGELADLIDVPATKIIQTCMDL
ncbi:MAG: translation initiation factor IF-2 N-terminal domain-containing protein, partial [Gemmatimonadota bacterium]